MNLPFTLKNTGRRTFKRCSHLKHVTLPERLELIEDKCFYGCTFDDITIPASVREIGECAFYWNLPKTIQFERGSELRAVRDYAFGGYKI